MTLSLSSNLLLSKRIKWFIGLCMSFLAATHVWADAAFLKPAEAFQIHVDTNKREVQWTIADGYYLYESRVKVSLVSDNKSNDKKVSVPFEFLTISEEKDDPNFGRVNVFHKEMAIKIGQIGDASNDIKLTYQGCAEAGLCYPPQSKVISFATGESKSQFQNTVQTPSAISQTTPSTIQQPQSSGEEGQLVKLLLNGERVWVLLTFFILGLGLTFTPCVLPMIPILAGIIAGQSGNITAKKGFFLSLAYVLGMSVSYSTAGVLVGVFGAQLNLQALFQTPLVLIAFSLVFVLLSLSMFGFYELQLPMFLRDRLDRLSQKSVGGPYIGVGIMGAVSALIVSPCVSAPLAGALIYISTTGDAVLGGSVLFVMSLGMGVPLLLVGLGGGKYLPKAGMWMMQVKAAFGVVLLGVAIALVSRMVSDTISVFLWSVLCIVYAVHLSPFQSSDNSWSKTRQGFALVLFLYGLSLLSSGLAGQPSLTSPLGYLKTSAFAVSETDKAPLFTRTDEVGLIENAMRQASIDGKPVIVDMYADWCTACLEMEKDIFSRTEVNQYRNSAVFLQLDLTKNTSEQQNFLIKYGVFGPPTLLFFSIHGDLINIRQGEIDLAEFMRAVDSTLATL